LFLQGSAQAFSHRMQVCGLPRPLSSPFCTLCEAVRSAAYAVTKIKFRELSPSRHVPLDKPISPSPQSLHSPSISIADSGREGPCAGYRSALEVPTGPSRQCSNISSSPAHATQIMALYVPLMSRQTGQNRFARSSNPAFRPVRLSRSPSFLRGGAERSNSVSFPAGSRIVGDLNECAFVPSLAVRDCAFRGCFEVFRARLVVAAINGSVSAERPANAGVSGHWLRGLSRVLRILRHSLSA
jgi:hypothetical protein